MTQTLVPLRQTTVPAGVHVVGWHPLDAPQTTFRGTADVHVTAWRTTVYGVAIFSDGTKAWVAPPTKPRIGKGDVVVRDKAGKQVLQPVLKFDDESIGRRFSEAVIDALRFYAPEALP